MAARITCAIRRRAAGAGVVVVLAVAALSACSPRGVGTLGVAKDSAGNLVVVSDACGEELDFMTFTLTSGGAPVSTAANGRLSYDKQDLGTFRLSDQERQLTVIGQVSDLRADVHYKVGAWDDDQSVSAGPIGFRADDIAALAVGEVHRGRAAGARTTGTESASASETVRMTVDKWLAAPCADKR